MTPPGATAAAAATAAERAPALVLRRRRRWRREPALALGTVLLLLLVASAVLAPVLAPGARDTIQLERRNEPPSAQHWFGTDDLGRDTLTRLLYGGRVSLAVAALATLVSIAIGASLGLVAGWRGGRTDTVIQHGTDVALSLPTFFVVLLLGAWFGARLATLCLVIGFTNWMQTARLVRAATLSLRERTFVDAARASGLSPRRILLWHVLPGVASPILVTAALAASQAVLVEAALGFLGFGLQPPTPSWGTMLQEAQAHVFDAPWRALFPGLPLVATVLALHLVADGLRDRLDPRLRTALR